MWNKCREVADHLPWLLFPCGIDIHGESKFLDTHCKNERLDSLQDSHFYLV